MKSLRRKTAADGYRVMRTAELSQLPIDTYHRVIRSVLKGENYFVVDVVRGYVGLTWNFRQLLHGTCKSCEHFDAQLLSRRERNRLIAEIRREATSWCSFQAIKDWRRLGACRASTAMLTEREATCNKYAPGDWRRYWLGLDV